jgi:hypothetical protein
LISLKNLGERDNQCSYIQKYIGIDGLRCITANNQYSPNTIDRQELTLNKGRGKAAEQNKVEIKFGSARSVEKSWLGASILIKKSLACISPAGFSILIL